MLEKEGREALSEAMVEFTDETQEEVLSHFNNMIKRARDAADPSKPPPPPEILVPKPGELLIFQGKGVPISVPST